MITDKNYDTMYDERDYRAEWEKEYKDEEYSTFYDVDSAWEDEVERWRD